MARLPNAALARIREIEADLRLVVDGGPSALAAVTAELPSLVQSDGALSYVLAPSAHTVRFQESFTERLPRAFLEALGDHMARQPVGWTMYNPLRPDPRQRNRVFYTDTILRLLGLPSTDSVPMYRDLFPQFAMTKVDVLRVLVCDGPSLLGYVSASRLEPFTDVEVRTLQRLVPALQRRLRIERILSTGPRTRGLFDAAFAAIPNPAFVTDAAGAVKEANAAAQAWLAREGVEVRAEVRRATRRGGGPRFTVTRVAARGAPELRLVVLRQGETVPVAVHAGAAAARWGFSAPQRRILELLVDGMSTRTMAATLAVAERTVETHLTAMFQKAQVESRSELVAAVWRRR